MRLLSCKIKFDKILIFLILAAQVNFFYLIPSFNIGPFKLADLDWILIILLFLIVIFRYMHFIINNPNKIFIFIELLLLTMVLSSSIAAKNSWQQPLLKGVSPQRELLIGPLLYLSLDVLVKNKKISVNSIFNILYAVCIIEMLVGFSQVIIGVENFDFTYVMANERFDSSRLYMEDSLIALTTFICLSNYIRRSSIKDLVFIFLSILFFLTVTKSRMAFFSLFLTILCGLIISKNMSLTKKTCLLLLCIFGVVILLKTEMGSMIIDSIFSKENNTSQDIREIGRSFYSDGIAKNPIFGAGFANVTWELSAIGSGINNLIFWVDNGIFGFTYYYGFIGVFILLVIYIRIWITGIKLYKYEKSIYVFLFIIYSFIGCLTLLAPGMEAVLAFPLLMFFSFTRADIRRLKA